MRLQHGDHFKTTNSFTNIGQFNNQFLTYEMIYDINKKHLSRRSITSKSTMFYDLDDFARRHSFSCLPDICTSKPDINKNLPKQEGCRLKSVTIVQECATQMNPKLLHRDSRHLNTKLNKRRKHKKRTLLQDFYPSSEILLRDDVCYDYRFRTPVYNVDDKSLRQKFWSFAKYHTELTNPKKNKLPSKDLERMVDPCPCQLFSYVCPCNDKNSLNETAVNATEIALSVVDRYTSTTTLTRDRRTSRKNMQRHRNHDRVTEQKSKDNCDEDSIAPITPIDTVDVMCEQEISKQPETQKEKKHKTYREAIPHKKIRRAICPKCKETMKVVSTTDEENLQDYSSFSYQNRNSSQINTSTVCTHEPRCELVPICQLLPTAGITNQTYNMTSAKPPPKATTKTVPRVIRITKACRHHPPCKVVPSCQRLHVLKSANCSYLPPCPHRPRCINLPLCAPLSKSIQYANLKNDSVEDSYQENTFIHQIYEEDPAKNISQVNMVPYMSTYEYPGNNYTGSVNPDILPHFPRKVSLSGIHSPIESSCYTRRSNKLCQYDSQDWSNNVVRNSSSDAVIFIRDVGCQFRNTQYRNMMKLSDDSLHYFNSDVCNIQALTLEDKYTNPIARDESRFSRISMSSSEIVNISLSNKRDSARDCVTGFNPSNSPYIGFIAHSTPFVHTKGHKEPKKTCSVKSSKSLRSRYRKMFAKGKSNKHCLFMFN